MISKSLQEAILKNDFPKIQQIFTRLKEMQATLAESGFNIIKHQDLLNECFDVATNGSLEMSRFFLSEGAYQDRESSPLEVPKRTLPCIDVEGEKNLYDINHVCSDLSFKKLENNSMQIVVALMSGVLCPTLPILGVALTYAVEGANKVAVRKSFLDILEKVFVSSEDFQWLKFRGLDNRKEFHRELYSQWSNENNTFSSTKKLEERLIQFIFKHPEFILEDEDLALLTEDRHKEFSMQILKKIPDDMINQPNEVMGNSTPAQYILNFGSKNANKALFEDTRIILDDVQVELRDEAPITYFTSMENTMAALFNKTRTQVKDAAFSDVIIDSNPELPEARKTIIQRAYASFYLANALQLIAPHGVQAKVRNAFGSDRNISNFLKCSVTRDSKVLSAYCNAIVRMEKNPMTREQWQKFSEHVNKISQTNKLDLDMEWHTYQYDRQPLKSAQALQNFGLMSFNKEKSHSQYLPASTSTTAPSAPPMEDDVIIPPASAPLMETFASTTPIVSTHSSSNSSNSSNSFNSPEVLESVSALVVPDEALPEIVVAEDEDKQQNQAPVHVAQFS